MDRLVG